MIDHQLETRLRAWYRRADAIRPAPTALRATLSTITEAAPASFGDRFRPNRRFLVLMVALLALLTIIAGSVVTGSLRQQQQAQRELSFLSTLNVCDVLIAAADPPTSEILNPDRFIGTGLDGHGCVVGYDWGWAMPHLQIGSAPTTLAVSERLVGGWFGLVRSEWDLVGPGRWLACHDREPWCAVSAWSDGIFFVVTGPGEAEVRALADAVESELAAIARKE